MSNETLAVIGGTGNIGLGLALRWADSGYSVIVGSRAQDRAEQAAEDINGRLKGGSVRGMANPEAASSARAPLPGGSGTSQRRGSAATRARLRMGAPPSGW